MADREGRLEDRPKRIKAEIIPYDSCNIDKLLNLLHQKKFIKRYSVNGCNYIEIINFKKHQYPHMKEPESTIPAPDKSDTSTEPTPGEHGSGPSESPIPITSNLNLVTEPPPISPPKGGLSLSPQDLAKLWNEKAPPELCRVDLPFNRKRNDLEKIKDALKRNPDKEWWLRVILLLHDLPFVRGFNDRGWKMTLDVMVRDAEKILDGKYVGTFKKEEKAWFEKN